MHLRRRAVLAIVTSVLAVSAPLVVVAPAARADPQQGVALPAGPAGMTAFQVSMGDGVVYALWGTTSATTTLYVAPDDGSGSWQQLHVPSTGEPVDNVLAVDDGVVVQYSATTSCPRVVTATTDWMAPGCLNTVVNVGHGGALVAVKRYVAELGLHVYDVYDAKAGPAGSVLDSTSLPPALDGTWVWTASRGSLSGFDTATGAKRSLRLGDSCVDATVLEVVGDQPIAPSYAEVRCIDGDTTRSVLVDLTGSARPFEVTGRPSMLGNGFLYAGGTGVVRALDLTTSLTEQDFAPFLARGWQWYPGRGWLRAGPADLSGTTSGTPRIAYLDDLHGVRVATLQELGAPPSTATDTTAPTITSTGGSPGVVRRSDFDTPISFTWSGQDDGAAAPSYVVQVKDSVPTDGAPGWQPLAGAQSTFATSAVYREPNQAQACFRVRAIDRVGNRSPWSTPRCTRVDGYRPVMSDAVDDTNGLLRVLRSVGRVDVTGRFHGGDDTAVTSYDVERRVAVPGQSFGSWIGPRSWKGLTTHHVTTSLAPGAEICFRARAHDAVGRVSTRGDKRCATEPYDDATWNHRRAASRRVAGALGGTATLLTHGRHSLSHTHLSGRILWVRARGAGCPHVWWGGERVLSLGCSNDFHGFSWYAVDLPRRHSGTIRVAVDGYWGWTEVDAVAVGR